MRADAFFELVEIRTKPASVLPYLTGTLYAFWRFERFEPVNALLMLVALLCLDLAVTALNHRSEAPTRYSTFYLKGRKYSRAAVSRLIVLLLVLSLAFGSVLAYRTGPITWMVGSLSFAAGILYSAGPLPLQRTPLGEALSGLFMGFFILFLACHIHLGDASFKAYVFGEFLTLEVNWRHLGMLLLISLPLVSAVFNLMLANNICDRTKDLANERYTLAVLLGERRALKWFRLVYAAGALAAVAAVLLRTLPLSGLLLVPAYAAVWRNIGRFAQTPDKRTTFPLAVANLNWIGLALIAALIAALIF